MKRFLILGLALVIPAVFAQNSVAPDKISAMLNEAPAEQSVTLDAVVLSAKDSDQRLESLPGAFSTTYAFVTVLMFIDFPDQHATVRITDTRPVLHLKIGANPHGRVYLVKTEINPKTNDRSVKLGHSGFGSVGGMTNPDAKWVVASTVTQDGNGIWKLVPDAPLAKGEYGIFTPNVIAGTAMPASGVLYGFGVD